MQYKTGFFFFFFKLGKNIILVPIFWNHSQFSSYILVAVNLVPAILNLKVILSLVLTL